MMERFISEPLHILFVLFLHFEDDFFRLDER